jgi:hypothetical protein
MLVKILLLKTVKLKLIKNVKTKVIIITIKTNINIIKIKVMFFSPCLLFFKTFLIWV